MRSTTDDATYAIKQCSGGLLPWHCIDRDCHTTVSWYVIKSWYIWSHTPNTGDIFYLWFVNVIIEKFPRQPGNECSLISLDVKLLTLTVALACLAPILILLESTTATAVHTSDKRATFAFACVAVWWVNHPATIPCTILWTLQSWTCSTGTWSSHTTAVWIFYRRSDEYWKKTCFNCIFIIIVMRILNVETIN